MKIEVVYKKIPKPEKKTMLIEIENLSDSSNEFDLNKSVKSVQ